MTGEVLETDQLDGGESPLSILNLLRPSKELVSAIKALPPEKLEATERELEKKISPSREHRLLKISFWDEYRRAQRSKSDAMVISNICHGICGRAYFYNKVVQDPDTLAWLITPPVDEMIVQKELLRIGYQKLSEVLDLPFVTKDTKMVSGKLIVNERVNVPLIKEVRAIVEQLQDRVHGAVIQRQQIESKSLSVNMTEKGEMSMEELTRLSKQLEQIGKRLPAEIEGEIAE